MTRKPEKIEQAETEAGLEQGDVIDLNVKSSPIPYYAQVRDALRRQILDGSLQPHQKMPSENQMVEMYGVSRITIRQALGELENEGLIFRVHGKGTFVAKPKAFQDLTHLQSFGEAMQPHGYETYSKVISMKELGDSGHVAERLGLAAGEPVVEIKRVRYLNRDPVSVESSYFSAEVGRRLMKSDLSRRDIFVVLENDMGILLGNADLVVGAQLADDLQARLLGLEEGAPLLHIERLTHSIDHTPVIYEHLYHRGDSFRYKVRVERHAGRAKGQQA